nr:PREDICTED: uncharacterized protein LOC108207828 [Daucus carota subsp. sativus]
MDYKIPKRPWDFPTLLSLELGENKYPNTQSSCIGYIVHSKADYQSNSRPFAQRQILTNVSTTSRLMPSPVEKSVCGLACVLALIICFAIIMHKFTRHLPEEPGSPGGSSHAARLQTFLSSVDEKEVDLKSKSKRRNMELASNVGVDEVTSVNRSNRSCKFMSTTKSINTQGASETTWNCYKVLCQQIMRDIGLYVTYRLRPTVSIKHKF